MRKHIYKIQKQFQTVCLLLFAFEYRARDIISLDIIDIKANPFAWEQTVLEFFFLLCYESKEMIKQSFGYKI